MAMMAMTTSNSMSVNPTYILSRERIPSNRVVAAGFFCLLKNICGFVKVMEKNDEEIIWRKINRQM